MKPLFRFANGETMSREEVTQLVRIAVREDDLLEEAGASHSLRIGGACAFYATFQSVELVKRFGRWKSDAFHGYLWESHEPQRGLAEGMVKDESSLTVQ